VAGDQLEIPINQTGKIYQAEITQAVVNTDGSVTWNGQLMDELGEVASESGSPYSVTITSGQKIVSGGIFTPEGHFVIEAVGDQGWIANASTLFKFDENKPDYVIPETH
jgi:aspartate 1-decarboxylase